MSGFEVSKLAVWQSSGPHARELRITELGAGKSQMNQDGEDSQEAVQNLELGLVGRWVGWLVDSGWWMMKGWMDHGWIAKWSKRQVGRHLVQLKIVPGAGLGHGRPRVSDRREGVEQTGEITRTILVIQGWRRGTWWPWWTLDRQQRPKKASTA